MGRNTDPVAAKAMRADARKNYAHVLQVAREVITEDGADASLRDIARRAGVGLGTLYRHFPTRESLLEAVLHDGFEQLSQEAARLERSSSPDEALTAWFRQAVTFTHRYKGAVDKMAAAIDDPSSALHASCQEVKSSGARLLARAQEAGTARPDFDGVDLLAFVAALAWINDQPSFAPRSDRLLDVVMTAIRTDRT